MTRTLLFLFRGVHVVGDPGGESRLAIVFDRNNESTINKETKIMLNWLSLDILMVHDCCPSVRYEF